MWKVKVLATQSYLTLCNPMDYGPPGSSLHGVLQARILEWVAIPFSWGSFQLWSNPGLLHCLRILYHLSHCTAVNTYVFLVLPYLPTSFCLAGSFNCLLVNHVFASADVLGINKISLKDSNIVALWSCVLNFLLVPLTTRTQRRHK